MEAEPEGTMRVTIGDRLSCSNPACGLQVTVTESGRSAEVGALPLCSCGAPMKKSYEKPTVQKVKLVREERLPNGTRGPRQ